MKKTVLALSIAQMMLNGGVAYAQQQQASDAPAASDNMEKIIVTATRRDTLV